MNNKLQEKVTRWLKNKYNNKNIEWKKSDDIFIYFWFKVAPILIWIPILFFIMKWFIIDILLEKRGFNEMVGYAIILIIIRPLIMDLLTKILMFKEEIKSINK